MYSYIKNPQQIYKKSFEIIRKESNLSQLSGLIEKVVVRCIHTTGDPHIVELFKYSPHAAEIAHEALCQKAPVLTDAKMVAAGVTQKRLPSNNKIMCFLNNEKVPELAEKIQNTRSAAAVELWRPFIKDSVVAIGNAPTALFYLLEKLEQGWPKPKIIIGMPVGFVGAAESKNALINNKLNVPYITLIGRRGGSALAVASVNAIATKVE